MRWTRDVHLCDNRLMDKQLCPEIAAVLSLEHPRQTVEFLRIKNAIEDQLDRVVSDRFVVSMLVRTCIDMIASDSLRNMTADARLQALCRMLAG